MGTYGQVVTGLGTQRNRQRTEPAAPMLAGHIVTQSMVNDANTAKAQGKRMLVITPGAIYEDNATLCANCGGLGVLELHVIDSGPTQNHPGGRVLWHGGGWCQTTPHSYACPVCSGMREIIL